MDCTMPNPLSLNTANLLAQLRLRPQISTYLYMCQCACLQAVACVFTSQQSSNSHSHSSSSSSSQAYFVCFFFFFVFTCAHAHTIACSTSQMEWTIFTPCKYAVTNEPHKNRYITIHRQRWRWRWSRWWWHVGHLSIHLLYINLSIFRTCCIWSFNRFFMCYCSSFFLTLNSLSVPFEYIFRNGWAHSFLELKPKIDDNSLYTCVNFSPSSNANQTIRICSVAWYMGCIN